MYQVICSPYIIEVEFESAETKGKERAVFVCAKVKKKVRLEQWEELYG